MLDAIHSFFFDTNDIETKAAFGHPAMPFAIIVFCKWIGPALMRDRKPFNLKYTLIVYNFAQVFANSYIVFKLTKMMTMFWDIRCLREASPIYEGLLESTKVIHWHVYLIKFVDLLDAVFFVLRRKENQISFLHLFHHAVICFLCVIYINTYNYGYYLLMTLTINTFIHIIMYLYYALAAFGPSMQKYLWWKKYLTIMQILQFVIVLIYMSVNFATGCEKTNAIEITFFLFILALLLLFLNFYRKSFKTE